MALSWQRPEWPNFSWNPDLLRNAEKEFRLAVNAFIETFDALATDDRDLLTVEILSAEAVATSEIEGEIFDSANVQSAIRSQLGQDVDQRRAKAAEQGIAELTANYYRSFGEPLSEAMLFDWHRMLTKGRSDLRSIGCYRTHDEPMQIVSGSIYRPKVHFEAPPSSAVSREMAQFIDWFDRTAPDGSSPLPALTRAGIAHFYFESIHPFEDGNGRIGRAIASKALVQKFAFPPLTALSLTILSKRKAYYEALESSQTEADLTAWLRWLAGAAIEAQQQTTILVDFFLEKRQLLDSLGGRLNERQQKALLRVLREGPSGFKGGLSADNYMTITGASPATTTRDLVDMLAKGALSRGGERHHARYLPNLPQRMVGPVTIDASGEIVRKGRHYRTKMGSATPDFRNPPRPEPAGATEPATADLLRRLVRDHVLQLIEAIEEAKQSFERDKENRPDRNPYNVGKQIALWETYRALFYRAGSLGIDLQEIGLEGVDPDDFL
jgi:Fic family protein